MVRFRSLTGPQQLSLLLYVLVTVVLWGFVWVHAFGMDMTHDEAYSFRLIKTNYFIALFGTANNHWLNSFFMELFNDLFGDGPGWVRLHSVLAFPFFAWALYRLGNLIKARAGAIIFWALVLLNPYVLDFFSLARGYGLAMTFQAWSLYYFIKAAQAPAFHYRSWLMVWLMNALMIAANLSYFYTAIGMAGFCGCVFITSLMRRQPVSKGLIRILVLYGLLLLGTVADLLFIKYYGKDLGFGGDDQLIASLMGSVWEGSLYGAAYGDLLPALTYCSFFLLLVVSGWYGWQALRHKKISTGFILAILFAGIVVLNMVFHLVLNNPYLLGRTALQWYVPGILLLCVAGSEWVPAVNSTRWAGRGIAVVVALIMGAHFYTRADRAFCFEWSLQANSRQALYDLYAQQPQHASLGFSLGGVHINYYSLIDERFQSMPGNLPDQNPDVAAPALREALQRSDYVITAFPVTLQCLQQLGLRYEVLKTYPPGNNQLIRIDH
ncbi:hypothetical protein [Paraflavitalea soli]|nr:hypothetical protein [Paraflavitalea soli]